MKRIYISAFLILSFTTTYGQKKNVKQPVDASAMATLNTEQKTAVKQVNKQFVADMKAILEVPATSPTERRQRIEKLKASRDSTLKAKLGEQTFSAYRKKAVITKQQQ